MKRIIYLILSTILGLLLSIILHAGIETLYLKYDHHLKWFYFFGIGLCALPAWLAYGLFFLGLIGGYFLGRFWWRLVYIENRRFFYKRR